MACSVSEGLCLVIRIPLTAHVPGAPDSVYVLPGSLDPGEAHGTQKARSAHPRSEKRKESFMPVEITGARVRAEKGIGGRIVLGRFAPGPFDSQGEPFDSQGELEAPAS